MRTSIIVQNLKCGGCANTIIKKRAEINNISNVFVNKETSKISFYAKNSDDVINVKDKIKSLSYTSIEK